MRIKSLTKVDVDKHVHTLSFGDGQGIAINLQPDGCSLKRPSVRFINHSTLPDGVCAVRTFCVEGKPYAQGSDNRIYVYEKSTWTPICNTLFTAPVNVISIIYEGEKRLLIFSAEKAVIKGLGEIEVALPEHELYAYTAGMLFMAKGNVLRFSKPFNFTDFTVDLELGGYLETEADLGEIVGIKGENNGVTIVCKNGIARLTTVGERTEYTFKKYDIPFIDVVPKSFASTPDAVCFISENSFCTFKKGALTSDTLPFDMTDAQITDNAVSARGFYLLPMRLKGVDTDYVYCREGSLRKSASTVSATKSWSYNGSSGKTTCKQGFLFDGRVALSNDGGFAADKMTNSVYKLSLADEGEEITPSTTYYKSRAIDFSLHDAKFITDIKVDCVGGFTLKVSGDFGTATFGIEGGRSHIKCNLQSTCYTFEVVGNEATEIKALSVTYRT